MFGPANIEAVLHDAEHDELDELENCEQTSTQEESQNTTNVTWERSLLNYLSQIVQSNTYFCRTTFATKRLTGNGRDRSKESFQRVPKISD